MAIGFCSLRHGAQRRLRSARLEVTADWSLALTLAALASAGYSLGAIFRYERFAAGAYDLGIFDQAVWGYSRFELVPNTVKGVRNLLGDHFHPIVALAAPLYWVWADPRALLAVQALLLGASSLPLYAFARRLLACRDALLIEVAYLVFVGVSSAALFDFHEVALAAPLLALALWALCLRRFVVFAGCCVLGALVKEDVALLFATLALYGAAAQSGVRRRLGYLLLAVLLAGWSVALTKVVIPALAARPYAYWSYGKLGNGLDPILVGIVRHPLLPLRLLVDDATKLATLAGLLGSFLFLPLLSPICLLAVMPLAERMWNTNPNYWTLHYHYSLTVAPILAFAAVEGLARLRRRAGHGRRILAVVPAALVLAAGAVTGITLAAWPMSALSVSASEATERCLATIPGSASVVATSALVPHLSRRSRIYTFHTLSRNVRPDVVAVNLYAQSGEELPASVADIVRKDLDGGGYRVSCRGGGTIILASQRAPNPRLGR